MVFAAWRTWTVGHSLEWFSLFLTDLLQYHCKYSLWNPKIVRKHPADRWECSMPKSLFGIWSNTSRQRFIWRKKTLDNPRWWGDVQLFKSMAWDVLIIVFRSAYILREILCHIRFCTLDIYIIRHHIYFIRYCALGKVWCAWYGMAQSSQKSRQSLLIGSCVIWQRDEAAEKF